VLFETTSGKQWLGCYPLLIGAAKAKYHPRRPDCLTKKISEGDAVLQVAQGDL
jgi:hypothetical protein